MREAGADESSIKRYIAPGLLIILPAIAMGIGAYVWCARSEECVINVPPVFPILALVAAAADSAWFGAVVLRLPAPRVVRLVVVTLIVSFGALVLAAFIYFRTHSDCYL